MIEGGGTFALLMRVSNFFNRSVIDVSPESPHRADLPSEVVFTIHPDPRADAEKNIRFRLLRTLFLPIYCPCKERRHPLPISLLISKADQGILRPSIVDLALFAIVFRPTLDRA